MPLTGPKIFGARCGRAWSRGLQKARSARKLGLRTALTGLVLLTVAVTAILIHLTWFYAARRNVADVVGQLNRQIVGSVQHEVRGTLNDAWSVQEAVQSIFFQEAIEPTDEAKREFIFLALLRSHPTLSWIALGFPDGAFFGALKAGDDEIDMVEVKQNAETGIRQQRVDTYTPEPGDIMVINLDFAGVIAVVVEMERLSRFLADLQVGKTGTVVLIERHGADSSMAGGLLPRDLPSGHAASSLSGIVSGVIQRNRGRARRFP